MMDKMINLFLFVLGLILAFLGLLVLAIDIVFVFKGFENENQKFGAYAIGFLMSPVAACGIRLMVKHRPRRRHKRIEISKILKLIQEKEHKLTNRVLVSGLNLTAGEADSALKELGRIGMGKVISDRFGQLELSIDKSICFNEMWLKTAFMNSVQELKKTTGALRWRLVVLASILLISISLLIILFSIPHCCGDGYYYIIFFSLIGGSSSTYLIWSYKRDEKKDVPKFIEIRG